MIVIGTPVHESKAYATTEWLDSVNALIMPDGVDKELIVIDNSPTNEFIRAFDALIKEKDYKFAKARREPFLGTLHAEERMGKSRDIFTNTIKKNKKTKWLLSWECDVIAPPDTLLKLMHFTTEFDVISLTYPDRANPDILCGGIGFALFNMEIFDKFAWMDNGGYGQCDLNNKNCYYGNDAWLAHRIIQSGYKLVELTNYVTLRHLGS